MNEEYTEAKCRSPRYSHSEAERKVRECFQDLLKWQATIFPIEENESGAASVNESHDILDINSIRQTDVDTLMIRTQSRVRVRVRVIYLNQTGISQQIIGGVGVRVMHSRSDDSGSNPTHSISNCFFP